MSRAIALRRHMRRGLCARPASSYDPKKPSVPDATTLFKATNPELLLDASERSSWKWPIGVVLFFGGYFGYLALYSPDAYSPPESKTPALPSGVVRTLDDGRWLMEDGSIQKPAQ